MGLAQNDGPVGILCKEIDFRFEVALESPDMLVAFVRALVGNIAEARDIQAAVGQVTGIIPSEGSATVLGATEEMLAEKEPDALIAGAVRVHDLAHELNPEETHPTDHLIDMLSSCASAIRFGLEKPCQSRHAAEAASHVWRHRYGIRLEDQHTAAWRKDWTRAQLQRAIIMRMIGTA